MTTHSAFREFEPFQAESSIGPKTNPAKLPTDGSSTVYSLLTKLFSAMEDSKDSGRIIKFLSRYVVAFNHH